MYRRHSIGTLGQAGTGLLFDVPDGAAGGSAVATAQDGDAHVDGGGAADADTGAADADPAATARGTEDDDADPLDTTDLIEHLPEANMRTQLRRSQRFAQRARPIVDRFRDASGKFLPTEHVDRIIGNAREFESIDRVLRASPRALEVLLEEQRRLDGQGGAPLDAAAAAQDVDQPFDEAKHPFETETEQGQYLLTLAKRNHANEQRLARLERGINTMQQQTTSRTITEIEGTWKTQTISAAKAHLQEGARKPFIEDVYQSFVSLRDSGKLTKANAQAVIDQHLARFAFAKLPTTAPATTRQSAMVAGNQVLPRVPRPGSTSPAGTGQAPKANETIRDSKQSMFRRFGKETPRP